MVELWGFPQSVADWFRETWREPWLTTIWKTLVTALVIVLAITLLTLGGSIFGVLAFLLLAVIFSDRVQRAVSDVYERRWANVDLSRLWPFAVVLVAGAVLVATLAVAVPTVVHAQQTFEIDAQHDLATEDAIQQWESEGHVSTNHTAPHLTLTMTEQVRKCGVEAAAYKQIRSDYLCINSHAEQTQTYRIWIPEAYFQPHIREEKAPLGDGPTASFHPVKEGNYTSIRLTIEGDQQVVYPIPKDVAASYTVLDRVDDRTERLFGVELWSYGTAWTVINQSQFGDEPSVAIHTDPERTVIQYDAAEGNATNWIPVPESQAKPDPVHRMQTRGAENTVYVVSETSDPPRIRYRVRGDGAISAADRAIQKVTKIDDVISETVRRVTPEWLQ